MFTSKQHLHVNLGVDTEIAQFFVDRKVPVDNYYWRDRLLYVAKGTGYLFIPLFFDLQYKCGVNREDVMNEGYIILTEKILSSAALYEAEKIGFTEHIENCKQIMTGKIRNNDLYNDLLVYFSDEELKPYKYLGTISKALNRGDSFLFGICFLDLEKPVLENVLQNWYALVPSFLLLDDIYDLQEDKMNKQENAVFDFGGGRDGVKSAIQFLHDKFNLLKIFNIKLGSFYENSLERRLTTDYMKSLLNN